jgi:uncharacterized protein
MPDTRVLLLCGGPIHDWRGVGAEVYAALESAAEPAGDRIDLTVERIDDDLSVLAGPTLADYDVIVLYYTRGVLADAEKNGLLNYVAGGGGFVGLHGATASFRDSPDFHAFIGGLFNGHPAPREYQVSVTDEAHPITEGIEEFVVFDEQYLTDFDPRVLVLANGLYKGKTMPVAWTKPWGNGRVFYLALGHDVEAARHEMFKLMLNRGVRWAARSD